jgi:anti-sigma B factor antagonist
VDEGRTWVDAAAFECFVSRRDGHCEVRLEGELDVATKPALEQAVETALELEAPIVAFDLKGVTFADSTAVAWLLAADRRIRTAGGQLRLVDCSPVVRHLLRLTGVDGRLALVERGPML